jgi:hypothetical protein
MKPAVFLFLILFSFNFQAQNEFSIQGNVMTKSKERIAIGDVLLFRNDKIVAYTSLSEGKFSLESLVEETYLLKIVCAGFEAFEKVLILREHKRLEFVLTASSEELDEVVIKATKRIIENKRGNVIANVDGTMLAKETNTIELLSKLPNLQVSPDGEQISILGKGNPLIYIGGQRISVEELQSIQVEEIKTIEIISNPSVKYEAAGRAVLLITKRRSNQEGTELSVTERASSKTYFNNYFVTNLTVKKSNLEYKLNASYNQLKIWEKNTADYKVIDKNVFSEYAVEAVTTRPQFIVGGGLYYALNATDYISFNTRFRSQIEPFTIDTDTFLDDNGTQQNINTSSNNHEFRGFSSSNINYYTSFNEKENLFLGVQYTNYTRDVENSIQNTFDDGSSLSDAEIAQDFNAASIVLKGDYDVVFKNKNRLELGVNYARNISKSLLEINQDKSNYEYSEVINALYSQFSGGKKKFKYSFGVRVENTNIEGGFKESTSFLVARKNTFIFPRGSVDFTLSEESSVIFSFVSSIARPNYSTSVTTTGFINPALEFQGNINLKPTITNELSSSFQWKDTSISLQFHRSKNLVNYRFFYDDIRDISIMSPTNFDEEAGFVFSFSSPFKYKFWTSTNNINFNYSSVKDTRIIKSQATVFMYIYSNQQFRINNLSSFNINGWAMTNRKDGVFDRRGVVTLNAAYTVKLFSKLDVTLSANDIFNTMEFRESYILQNLNVNSLFFTDINEFSIALRYVFGAVKDSKYKNKSVDDELNRMN